MSDLPPTSEYPQYGPPSNDPTQAQAYPPPAAPGTPPAPGYAPGQAPVYGQQQPVSGPPQGYGQPPAAPQAGWQQQPPYLQQAEQPKSNKALLITLSIVAALLVCLCVAGIAGAIYYTNVSNEANATPSASTSKSSPTPTKSSTTAKSNVTLKAPDTIGSRKKNNDAAMQALAEGMKDNFTGLGAGAAGDPVVAIYGDMGKGDMMMVMAFPQTVPGDSQIVLDAMFKGMESSGTGSVANKTSVPPGKLGGSAQCADVKIQTVDLATCGWADEVSVGIVMFYFSTVSKVKGEFITVREAIETKS